MLDLKDQLSQVTEAMVPHIQPCTLPECFDLDLSPRGVVTGVTPSHLGCLREEAASPSHGRSYHSSAANGLPARGSLAPPSEWA